MFPAKAFGIPEKDKSGRNSTSERGDSLLVKQYKFWHKGPSLEEPSVKADSNLECNFKKCRTLLIGKRIKYRSVTRLIKTLAPKGGFMKKICGVGPCGTLNPRGPIFHF